MNARTRMKKQINLYFRQLLKAINSVFNLGDRNCWQTDRGIRGKMSAGSGSSESIENIKKY